MLPPSRTPPRRAASPMPENPFQPRVLLNSPCNKLKIMLQEHSKINQWLLLPGAKLACLCFFTLLNKLFYVHRIMCSRYIPLDTQNIVPSTREELFDCCLPDTFLLYRGINIYYIVKSLHIKRKIY